MVSALLCLFLAGSPEPAQLVDIAPNPIPGCGEAAAWSLLECSGREVTLNELHARASSICSGVSPSELSILDVRKLLSSFGLPTSAIRIPERRMRMLTPPCILYFRPGKWPWGSSQEVGHFVTLVKFTGSEAVVLDWSGVTVHAALHIPLSELDQAWSGEAIVPIDSLQSRTRFLWPVVLLISAVAAMLLKIRNRSTRGGNLLLACCAILLAGCTEDAMVTAEPTEPLLAFSAPMARIGRVAGERSIEQDFEFRVPGKHPVTITGFITSCGCTTPSSDLIGRPLAPGTTHKLRVRVRPDGTGDVRTRTIQLLTKPESRYPISVGVQYQVISPPRVSVARVIADTQPGQSPVADVKITYRRLPEDRPIPLVRNRCQASHFEIVDVQSTSEEITVNAQTNRRMIVDTTVIKLRGRQAWHAGRHLGSLKLTLSDHTEFIVPTEIRVQHPLQPKLDRVFCGILGPRESWSAIIPCQPENPGIAQIESAESTGVSVSISLNDAGDLELRGSAPAAKGRFATEVTIHFEPPRIPPLAIPVSGVVR